VIGFSGTHAREESYGGVAGDDIYGNILGGRNGGLARLHGIVAARGWTSTTGGGPMPRSQDPTELIRKQAVTLPAVDKGSF
jgi:hypothetical protein